MKTRFKLLSTSLIVALSFASSQASYGMENNDHETPNKPKIQWKDCNVGDLKTLPRNVAKKILGMAIYQQAVDEGKNPGNIGLTCKVFQGIIVSDTEEFNKKETFALNTRFAFLEGLKGYYNITTEEQTNVFNRIYNGKLVYTDPKTKKTTELLISELRHPLEGTFDLSKCGDTGQYLSINMGYRKKMNSENAGKVEIWVAPRFLIEKELNANASHFQPIMGTWKQEQAPVGMFWTWGGWNKLDCYDYLTSSTTDELSKINLLENWKKSMGCVAHFIRCNAGGGALCCGSFHIAFVN